MELLPLFSPKSSSFPQTSSSTSKTQLTRRKRRSLSWIYASKQLWSSTKTCNKSNGYDTVKVSRRVFNIFASQADFEIMFETTQSFSLTFNCFCLIFEYHSRIILVKSILYLLNISSKLDRCVWKECHWQNRANEIWKGPAGWLHLNGGIIYPFDQGQG